MLPVFMSGHAMIMSPAAAAAGVGVPSESSRHHKPSVAVSFRKRVSNHRPGCVDSIGGREAAPPAAALARARAGAGAGFQRGPRC